MNSDRRGKIFMERVVFNIRRFDWIYGFGISEGYWGSSIFAFYLFFLISIAEFYIGETGIFWKFM